MNATGAFRVAGLFALGTLSLVNTGVGSPPLGVYDGNGVLLGAYLGSDAETIEFATSKGFVAHILVDNEVSSDANGTIEGMSAGAGTWNSSDCSGPALSEVPVAGRLVWIHAATEQLGYIATDATPVTLAAGTIVSGYEWPDYQCVTRTLSRTTTFLPAQPNDPNVTGISGGVVALPIRVAFIDRVFQSGFERLS